MTTTEKQNRIAELKQDLKDWVYDHRENVAKMLAAIAAHEKDGADNLREIDTYIEWAYQSKDETDRIKAEIKELINAA